MCNRRLSSIPRLRTHVVAVHGLRTGSVALSMAVAASQRLAAPYWHVGDYERLLRLIGTSAHNDEVVRMLLFVLWHHNVRIEGAPNHLLEQLGNNHLAGDFLLKERCEDITSRGANQNAVGPFPGCVTDSTSGGNTSLRGGNPSRPDLGRGSRSEVSSALKKSLLTRSFSSIELGHVASVYLSAVSSLPEARKASSCLRTAQYVHRFVAFVQALSPVVGEENEWKIVLRTDFVREYVEALKGIFRPHTVRNHSQELVKFLRDVGSIPALLKSLPPGLRKFRENALSLWEKTLVQLNKYGRHFQRTRVVSGYFKPCSFFGISCYLRDNEVIFKVNCAFVKLEEHFGTCDDVAGQGVSGAESGLIDCWVTIVRYLVTSVLMQGMRLCVVQNIKLSEFDSKQQHGPYYIVRVREHKTSVIYGDAAFVLNSLTKDLWERYRALRSKVAANKEVDYFFVSSSGTQVSGDLLKDLNVYLSRNGHPEVNHTHVRKSIESLNSIYGDELGSRAGAMSDHVQNYLCHSPAVVKKHYSFRTNETVVYQWTSVRRVVSQDILLEFITRKANDILPRDPLGIDFPTRKGLLSRVKDLCPKSQSDFCEMTQSVYRQIQLKWTQSYLKSIVEMIRCQISSKVFSKSSEMQECAKELVNNLGEVWVPMKSEILLSVLNCWNG